MIPFIELLVVLAFGAGWLVLESVCRKLDREKEERDAQARQDHKPQVPSE